MDDVTKGLLIGGILSLLTVIIPAIVNFRKNKAEQHKLFSEADSIDTDTIRKLYEQVNILLEDKIKTNERIENIEKELKRYVNAYARAVRYIHDNISNVEIPNFMETDPRIKAK